jgi:hypothetical protein
MRCITPDCNYESNCQYHCHVISSVPPQNLEEFYAVCEWLLAGFFEAMLIQIFVWSTASLMPASASSSQLRATVSASLETSRVELADSLTSNVCEGRWIQDCQCQPFCNAARLRLRGHVVFSSASFYLA